MEARGEEGGDRRLIDGLGDGGGLCRIIEARGEWGAEGPRARGEGDLLGCILRRASGEAIGEEGGESCLDIIEGGLWALIKPLLMDGCGEGLRLCANIGEGTGEAIAGG